MEKDGEILFAEEQTEAEAQKQKPDKRQLLNVRDILQFADEVRLEDVEEVI